jgi:hypothetical protein
MTERHERKPQLRHGSREVTTTQSVEHKVLRYRVRSSYSEWRTKQLMMQAQGGQTSRPAENGFDPADTVLST